MTSLRAHWQVRTLFLSACFLAYGQAIALPQNPIQPGSETDLIASSDKTAAVPANLSSPAASESSPSETATSSLGGTPAGYPAGTGSSSTWAPTHFEVFGDVQWRNLTTNSGFSSSYCLPSGCVTNTGSFSTDLPLKKWGVGPDFGFIWTPEKKILGATSKIWVEWEQLDRSNTRNISASFTFNGVTYAVDTALQAQLNMRLFSLGYAPQWGNDKFRIGPEIVYQHLGVDVTLANLTPGAPPPATQSINVPNNLAIIGLNFDYKPVQQLAFYGRSGWIPCCGGGWHGNQTEFGAKYYIRRNIGIIGGVRYYWLKRDFNLAAQEVTTPEGPVTLGPFSGYIKFPGVGPFVGASFRF